MTPIRLMIPNPEGMPVYSFVTRILAVAVHPSAPFVSVTVEGHDGPFEVKETSTQILSMMRLQRSIESNGSNRDRYDGDFIYCLSGKGAAVFKEPKPKAVDPLEEI